MKTSRTFVLLSCALLAAVFTLRAERDDDTPDAPDNPGAEVLFVNAVADKGLAFFVIDGQDANPSGFPSGRATGWVFFEAGRHEFQLEHQPLGTVDLGGEFAAGQHVALILHNENVSQEDRGRPPRPSVGVLRLACDDFASDLPGKKQRRLVVINATAAETVSLRMGSGGEREFARLKPESVDLPVESGFVEVRLADAEKEAEPLLTLNLEGDGVRFLVLRDAEDGDTAHNLFLLSVGGEDEPGDM
jgi:hypothetical protein